MTTAYILEVSSPGLGRPLKKEKDFERSMGKEVEIRTVPPCGQAEGIYRDPEGIMIRTL